MTFSDIGFVEIIGSIIGVTMEVVCINFDFIKLRDPRLREKPIYGCYLCTQLYIYLCIY